MELVLLLEDVEFVELLVIEEQLVLLVLVLVELVELVLLVLVLVELVVGVELVLLVLVELLLMVEFVLVMDVELVNGLVLLVVEVSVEFEEPSEVEVLVSGVVRDERAVELVKEETAVVEVAGEVVV